MPSDQKFVDYVLDQIQNAGEITAKKMFGEYAIYSDEKLFGLICDNQLFIKPTQFRTSIYRQCRGSATLRRRETEFSN